MNLLEAIKMGYKNILANKVRSFLTMLGIIIGITSVISLVSIGEGSTRSITEKIESLGTNMLNVTIIHNKGSRKVESEDMLKFAKENIDVIKGISPVLKSSVTVKYFNNNLETNLEGVSGIYLEVNNLELEKGIFLNNLNIDDRSKVVVLGSYINNELFSQEDSIGKKIKINGVSYIVVGVIAEKSDSLEGSKDDKIYIPYTTAIRLLKNSNIKSYVVQSENKETINKAEEIISTYLYDIFNTEDAYRIFNQAEMLDTVNETTATLKLLLGSIAGISLLVGGIGIMNIMLVSVTERTKEIGVRKAIGAKRKDILLQFLVESMFLSCIGGVIGIILGIVISYILGNFMGIIPVVSNDIIILAVSFAIIIGVFFGMYPANKASKLNPIDALRYE